MTLYEINQEIQKLIEESIDPETGEITDSPDLNALQLTWYEKVENIGLFIKNLRAEAEAIKNEKMSLAKRQAAAEHKADWLEQYLQAMMEGQTYKSPKVAIGYRKSTKAICDDPSNLPIEFMKVTYEPRLNLIKDALKKGEKIDGCHLEEINNIQIK